MSDITISIKIKADLILPTDNLARAEWIATHGSLPTDADGYITVKATASIQAWARAGAEVRADATISVSGVLLEELQEAALADVKNNGRHMLTKDALLGVFEAVEIISAYLARHKLKSPTTTTLNSKPPVPTLDLVQ